MEHMRQKSENGRDGNETWLQDKSNATRTRRQKRAQRVQYLNRANRAVLKSESPKVAWRIHTLRKRWQHRKSSHLGCAALQANSALLFSVRHSNPLHIYMGNYIRRVKLTWTDLKTRRPRRESCSICVQLNQPYGAIFNKSNILNCSFMQYMIRTR